MNRIFDGFMHGVGIGGWLTNYKRLRFLPKEMTYQVTKGDLKHFDAYITESDIRQIASWGADHIRLAFDYLVIEDENTPFIYKEDGFRHLDNCLEWCSRHGLNLVFDLHRASGSMCEFPNDTSMLDEPLKRERFIKLWQTIARRYKSQDGNIAFELLNELCTPPEYNDKWNQLVLETIDAIRQISPERKIVIGGTGFGAVGSLGGLPLIDDPNIIYTFHAYEPVVFTHQLAVNAPLIAAFNQYMEYPGNAADYAEFEIFAGVSPIYEGFERVDRKWLEHWLLPSIERFRQKSDAPLYCGEFGVIRHADIQSRENYYRDIIGILRENQIAYAAWNYLSTPYDANRFSIVDDWDRKPLLKNLIQLIGEKEC